MNETIDAMLKENNENWNGPFHFLTPQNIKVDVYLFKTNNKLRKVLEELLVINEAEKTDLERLKIETIDLFKSENKSKSEIKDLVEKILFKEFLNKMYDKIIKNEELNLIHPGLGQLLVEQSKSTLIIKEVCDQYQQEINYHMDKYSEQLKNHKIRFLINAWVDEKMEAEKERYTNLNPYEIHIRSIEKCKEQNLAQSAYFLEREVEFFKQKRDKLEREYKKIKNPSKVFTFKRFIWFPKNYKVKNIGTNKSPKYILEKSIGYTNSSSYLFWRWMNFLMRTGINFLNFIFLFGLVIPFSSPVSFRALFSIKPFYPGKDVNPRTGTLIQSSTKVNSYFSRLRALWNHIQVSRSKFESTPDKGLIGKGLQRIFNVFWNYIIKGLFGTLGLSLINPILCLSCSIGSLALCISTPLWYQILTLKNRIITNSTSLPRLARFFRVFIWDFFICGLLQPVAALSTSLVLCPIASSARNAKIPSCDTFIARRVEGPGIALDYFVQAKPEQILAALEVALEIKIINSYLKNIYGILEQPKNDFKKLFDQLFKKYSLELNSSLEPYSSVSENVSKNVKKYEKEANKRLSHLNKIIKNHQSSKIRLSEKDLKIVVLEAAKIIKKHYLDSILNFMNKKPHALFVENNLRDDDWKGLAEIELETLFGKGFLCPLEETDYYFSLSIDHLNLAKYTDMLASSEIRDDLEKVNIKYTPKSEILTIDNQFNYINHFYGSIYNKSHHFENSSEILWSKFKN
ncbi:hypothetical protein BpHYR1_011891 [Brachionus plicatilis]|uniref:Uncharacterized protein n=1 Tax=Brachionus plicatilis TaxID=10195 RepID=A0A3M7RCA9_BRAPC|nr:hypothetical protein BpHYR1_011891 [Brachionus plicatilis]